MPRFNDSLPILPPDGTPREPSRYNLKKNYEQPPLPDNMSAGSDNANRQWRHYGPIEANNNTITKNHRRYRQNKGSGIRNAGTFFSLPILLLASLAVIFSAFAFYRANQVYLALDQVSGNLLSAAQTINKLTDNSRGSAVDNGDGNQARPSQPDQPVDVAVEKDDPVLGNPDAPVTIVEFSDFECPFCKRFAPTVEQILKDFPDRVRLVYRDFPLTAIHNEAQSAALAAQCSFKLGGNDTFFKYHDELFANQAQLGPDLYAKTAAKLSLDAEDFAACQKDPAIAAEVDKDLQDGIAAGVQGTPATFINGQPINGAVPLDQLKTIIESKLK